MFANVHIKCKNCKSKEFDKISNIKQVCTQCGLTILFTQKDEKQYLNSTPNRTIHFKECLYNFIGKYESNESIDDEQLEEDDNEYWLI